MNFTLLVISTWIKKNGVNYNTVCNSLNLINDDIETSNKTKFYKSTLSKILSGKQGMSISTLDLFSRYMEIETNKLVSTSAWTKEGLKDFLYEKDILKTNILSTHKFKNQLYELPENIEDDTTEHYERAFYKRFTWTTKQLKPTKIGWLQKNY